jgi:hypothetical protein
LRLPGRAVLLRPIEIERSFRLQVLKLLWYPPESAEPVIGGAKNVKTLNDLLDCSVQFYQQPDLVEGDIESIGASSDTGVYMLFRAV